MLEQTMTITATPVYQPDCTQNLLDKAEAEERFYLMQLIATSTEPLDACLNNRRSQLAERIRMTQQASPYDEKDRMILLDQLQTQYDYVDKLINELIADHVLQKRSV